MLRRRELKITYHPVRLMVCIALGIWLGAVAIGLSLWLAWQLWPQQVEPLAQALAPAKVATPSAAAPTAAPADSQQAMFERYQQILREQQARDAIEADPRHLDNPKCQFWLQQNRTAPTANSQAKVAEFCR
ncbi:hypothetical protein IAE35_07885 [Pseudomonas sp. S75]|uniref:hypothetical protein n=1 Tax=unclassified Pseudomonas TaxID=196821 RepID=UPI001907D59E|nr:MULTISPECIES: hypothetical protein [unclassified Pseudomonas]MBJ9975707.1 hypothetical protein [Pseudomonas sp. S30]MBK0153258.1 hypothetical protein [Pseudomonas sp. S75]